MIEVFHCRHCKGLSMALLDEGGEFVRYTMPCRCVEEALERREHLYRPGAVERSLTNFLFGEVH